ncbi:hypothetical protein Tco_0769395, partial [Tanacetum coccineum]
VSKKKNEGPLGVLPCQLPPKELSPGSFTLPCTIGSLNMYALVDLGASVNIMSYSMFKCLKLTSLKETSMLVEMVDMSKKAPLGIVENVLVKIDKFVFPSDFLVINMLGDPNETMILGRPFLVTIHARINVFRDSIYWVDEHGVLKQWFCYRDNKRRDVKEKEMLFSDFLQIRYGNSKLDDITREKSKFIEEQYVHGTTKDLKKNNDGKAVWAKYDNLPLGRENGSRFKGMFRKEMDTAGSVTTATGMTNDIASARGKVKFHFAGISYGIAG